VVLDGNNHSEGESEFGSPGEESSDTDELFVQATQARLKQFKRSSDAEDSSSRPQKISKSRNGMVPLGPNCIAVTQLKRAVQDTCHSQNTLFECLNRGSRRGSRQMQIISPANSCEWSTRMGVPCIAYSDKRIARSKADSAIMKENKPGVLKGAGYELSTMGSWVPSTKVSASTT
jgi:hypothetical protein